MKEDFVERRGDSVSIRIARLEERLEASAKALDIARTDLDRRLLAMNQLREQIANERTIYIRREEYEIKHANIINTLGSLQKFQWSAMGALAALQVIVGILLYYLKR